MIYSRQIRKQHLTSPDDRGGHWLPEASIKSAADVALRAGSLGKELMTKSATPQWTLEGNTLLYDSFRKVKSPNEICGVFEQRNAEGHALETIYVFLSQEPNFHE